MLEVIVQFSSFLGNLTLYRFVSIEKLLNRFKQARSFLNRKNNVTVLIIPTPTLVAVGMGSPFSQQEVFIIQYFNRNSMNLSSFFAFVGLHFLTFICLVIQKPNENSTCRKNHFKRGRLKVTTLLTLYIYF